MSNHIISFVSQCALSARSLLPRFQLLSQYDLDLVDVVTKEDERLKSIGSNIPEAGKSGTISPGATFSVSIHSQLQQEVLLSKDFISLNHSDTTILLADASPREIKTLLVGGSVKREDLQLIHDALVQSTSQILERVAISEDADFISIALEKARYSAKAAASLNDVLRSAT